MISVNKKKRSWGNETLLMLLGIKESSELNEILWEIKKLEKDQNSFVINVYQILNNFKLIICISAKRVWIYF